MGFGAEESDTPGLFSLLNVFSAFSFEPFEVSGLCFIGEYAGHFVKFGKLEV
jgi:hypothetical protein